MILDSEVKKQLSKAIAIIILTSSVQVIKKMSQTTIWVNEQIDPGGLVYACIACKNEEAANDCHQNWQNSLTETQKQNGWVATLRTVNSWDDVPVNALKLSF